jgi:hypothetical protein
VIVIKPVPQSEDQAGAKRGIEFPVARKEAHELKYRAGERLDCDGRPSGFLEMEAGAAQFGSRCSRFR